MFEESKITIYFVSVIKFWSTYGKSVSIFDFEGRFWQKLDLFVTLREGGGETVKTKRSLVLLKLIRKN